MKKFILHHFEVLLNWLLYLHFIDLHSYSFVHINTLVINLRRGSVDWAVPFLCESISWIILERGDLCLELRVIRSNNKILHILLDLEHKLLCIFFKNELPELKLIVLLDVFVHSLFSLEQSWLEQLLQ